MVLVQACSQTEEEMVAAFATDTQAIANPAETMLNAMSMVDFKEDFVSYTSIRKPLNANTCPLIFKHRKSIYIKDKIALMDAYIPMKSDMIRYHNEDAAYHGGDLQHLALRMLRYNFLPDNSEVAIEETRFLLNILIESNAVDLDVLADAYAKVEHLLTDQEKADYMNYFRTKYLKYKKFVAEKFEIYKKGYETSTGVKKNEFLYSGRSLVRTSQSLRYVNDLLKIETEQKN